MKFKVLLLIAVVLVGGFGYKWWDMHKLEQAGKNKFAQALYELRTNDPGANNPCLGTSVLRNYSYKDLAKESIETIKALVLKDPGSC